MKFALSLLLSFGISLLSGCATTKPLSDEERFMKMANAPGNPIESERHGWKGFSKPKDSDVFATPVKGHPGYFFSPYAPNAGSIEAFWSYGTPITDPFSGKRLVIPRYPGQLPSHVYKNEAEWRRDEERGRQAVADAAKVGEKFQEQMDATYRELGRGAESTRNEGGVTTDDIVGAINQASGRMNAAQRNAGQDNYGSGFARGSQGSDAPVRKQMWDMQCGRAGTCPSKDACQGFHKGQALDCRNGINGKCACGGR